MADATKNCELFSFRSLFAGAKTPLQCYHWLIKAPPPLRLPFKKDQTATALLTGCKAHSAAFVSVVSAGCLVHFLTFVSNLSKKSNIYQGRIRFNCIHALGYISRSSFRLCLRRHLYLPAKLIHFYHTNK